MSIGRAIPWEVRAGFSNTKVDRAQTLRAAAVASLAHLVNPVGLQEDEHVVYVSNEFLTLR
jgi:hypothetical protein